MTFIICDVLLYLRHVHSCTKHAWAASYYALYHLVIVHCYILRKIYINNDVYRKKPRFCSFLIKKNLSTQICSKKPTSRGKNPSLGALAPSCWVASVRTAAYMFSLVWWFQLAKSVGQQICYTRYTFLWVYTKTANVQAPTRLPFIQAK